MNYQASRLATEKADFRPALTPRFADGDFSGEIMSSDWNWNDGDNKSLTVVRQVDAIAIYRNTDDDIVIRQRNDMEEDSVIVFPDSHIDDVIAGLQRVK